MQELDQGHRLLFRGALSMGVIAGTALLLGIPWLGVLVALVTVVLSAATVQGLRRRRDDEPRGRILHMRNRRGGRY